MEERRTVQQKCAAMLAAKDVTQRAANASLRELKDTILQAADPTGISSPAASCGT